MSGWMADSQGYYKEKDAHAILDYGHDWTDELRTGDIILTSSWVADTGITITLPTISGSGTITSMMAAIGLTN